MDVKICLITNHAQLYTYIGETAACGYRGRLDGVVHCRVRIRAHTCLLVIPVSDSAPSPLSMARAAVQDVVEVALGCRCTHRMISIHGSSFLSKIQYLINAHLKDAQLHQNCRMVHKNYMSAWPINSVHYPASTTIKHTNKAHFGIH